MIIHLTPEIETKLNEAAQKRGVAPEELALATLKEGLAPSAIVLTPRDEWERRLLSLPRDCGVSLSDKALSREELYD